MNHLTSLQRPLFRGQHVAATYRKEHDPRYRGNPLIEALPALRSRQEVAALMLRLPPPPTANERTLPHHEREHLLTQLGRFKVPLTQDLSLYSAIQDHLRRGYVGRNPFAPGGAEVLDERQQIQRALDCALDAAPQQITRLGVSGGGKSLAVRTSLSLIPQTIQHTQYGDRPYATVQVPWLILDCPHDGSARGLCIDFFAAMDSLLLQFPTVFDQDNPNEERTLSRRYLSDATTDKLLSRMGRVASMFNLGLLCFDEVQVLSEAKSGGASQLLNFMLKLVNTVGVPIMLIGTYKAQPLIASQLRLARRSGADSYWEALAANEMVATASGPRTERGGDWDVFTRAMWSYQYTNQVAARSDDLLDTLHEESAGIPDLAIKLFALTQRRAIQLGEQGEPELITSALITSVAESELRLVRPIILALRDGRRNVDLLARLDDVLPRSLESLLSVRPAPEIEGKNSSPEVLNIGAAPVTRSVNSTRNPDVDDGEQETVKAPFIDDQHRSSSHTAKASAGLVGRSKTRARQSPQAVAERPLRQGLQSVAEQAREHGIPIYLELHRLGFVGDLAAELGYARESESTDSRSPESDGPATVHSADVCGQRA